MYPYILQRGSVVCLKLRRRRRRCVQIGRTAFPVFGRRFLTKVTKDAVELGKACESAFGCNVSDGFLAVNKEILAVTYPDQLDIMGDGVAGNTLKLVRQVVGTHPDTFGQYVQSQIFHEMGMYIVGHRINLLGKLVLYIDIFINIIISELTQAIQELRENAVHNQLMSSCQFLGSGLV